MSTPIKILQFWFDADNNETASYRQIWFQPDANFRQEAQRFEADYESASRGELSDWQRNPEGALALILLLDQFPNLLFPKSARAFESDELAREVTYQALENGFDQQFPDIHRWFFYLPLEHSENLHDQQRAVELFGALEQNEINAVGLDFAKRHQRVIERFGRFPNRNQALGRQSTPAEEEFLAGPDAPF